MSNALNAFTTFGIGGAARRLFIAKTREELAELAPSSLVLGGGSNVLVSDDGYDGTVVIDRYDVFSREGEVVTVGSGARLPALCARLAAEGLSGLEWACGIPGSAGGAARINAGAHGSSVSGVFLYADVLRGGKCVRLMPEDMRFGYRSSALGAGDTVIDVAFRLRPDSRESIRRRMAAYAAARKASQPSGKSAGSVFKNPPGQSIGRLIEQAGLKGYAVGGARISQKHANFIINTGGATARDVRAVINTVKRELLRFGVTAREEIIYIGEFG